MIKHYFIIAFRSLWRNKFHALINVIGLAIGVSACLVIYLIVSHELSFNKSIPEGDRIYRIHSQFSGEFSGINRGVPTAAAPFVRENIKGVERATQFMSMGAKVEVKQPGDPKLFDKISTIAFVDQEYFNIINIYDWLAGNESVLTQPHQVVLTDEQARKYFGEVDLTSLLGKEIIYRDSLTVYVGGVVAQKPGQTDFILTDFISLPTIEHSWLNKRYFQMDSWTSINSSTQLFVKVDASTTQEALEKQCSIISKQYNDKNTWAKNDFAIQPLSDLHYNTTNGIFDFSGSAAHLPTLLTLSAVAGLLLVIGAINFINLETAQALRRAKEVGVRKVLGSSRSRLVGQFLLEGLSITVIAVALSIPLSEIGLSLFAEFIPAGLTLHIVSILPFLAVVIIFVGILASAYPAFVLSSFLPVLALKNQASLSDPQSRTVFLRKTLIVFQFAFAQVLIIATLVISWQIRYMLNKDLGFNKEAVVYFDTPWWEKSNKRDVLINELKNIPEIQNLCLSEQPPMYPGWSSSTIKYNNGKEETSVNTFQKFGNPDFISFYDIQLLAGRDLLPSDTVKELIINETLLKKLGFTNPQAAIGQLVEFGQVKLPVVGVVKDFHTQSLHKEIDPVIIADASERFSCINLKFTTQQESQSIKCTLEKVEAAWKRVYPEAPFKYEFLDETVRAFYTTEQRSVKLSTLATALAIFISCLGLFGLASFTALQRTKEIGIRKVLGASIQEIVILLTKDFMLLVGLAFVVAAPVAIYAIHYWLDEFSFRVNISVWLFVATAFVSLVVAFATVGFQTFKAARMNPVDSLKTE